MLARINETKCAVTENLVRGRRSGRRSCHGRPATEPVHVETKSAWHRCERGRAEIDRPLKSLGERDLCDAGSEYSWECGGVPRLAERISTYLGSAFPHTSHACTRDVAGIQPPSIRSLKPTSSTFVRSGV